MSGLQCQVSLRRDEIHHGFRLRQVQPAMEEGTLGEFSRIRQSRPRGQYRIQDAPRH